METEQLEKPSKLVEAPPKKDGTPFFTLAELKARTIDELRPHLKDVRGAWRTATLFEETCEDPAKYPPFFTLQDDDTASTVSLKRLYLAIEDITEYTFVTTCLGSWEQWEAMQNSWVLRPHIEQWRDTLERQLRAKYIRLIKEQAEYGEGPNALNATKYLLEQTTQMDKSKRGRPSKKEKEAHLARETKDSAALAADAKRLGISIVK